MSAGTIEVANGEGGDDRGILAAEEKWLKAIQGAVEEATPEDDTVGVPEGGVALYSGNLPRVWGHAVLRRTVEASTRYSSAGVTGDGPFEMSPLARQRAAQRRAGRTVLRVHRSHY